MPDHWELSLIFIVLVCCSLGAIPLTDNICKQVSFLSARVLQESLPTSHPQRWEDIRGKAVSRKVRKVVIQMCDLLLKCTPHSPTHQEEYEQVGVLALCWCPMAKLTSSQPLPIVVSKTCQSAPVFQQEILLKKAVTRV
jgi:hypothetical protein